MLRYCGYAIIVAITYGRPRSKVLVTNDEACALIDWECGGAGNPRYDLVLATRPRAYAFRTASDTAVFYAGYGGQPCLPAVQSYVLELYEFY